MQSTVAEEKDLSQILFQQCHSSIGRIWGKTPSSKLRGLEIKDIDDYVTGVVFDDYINRGLEFQVYGTKQNIKAPVIKIFNDLHDGAGRIEFLRKRINFARSSMGDLMAPFDVLTDVRISHTDQSGGTLNAVLQPVVIVQRRLERIEGDRARVLMPQIVGLFEGLCARGIRYSEKLSLGNIGYDPISAKVYLVDLGCPRFETCDKMMEAVQNLLNSQKV